MKAKRWVQLFKESLDSIEGLRCPECGGDVEVLDVPVGDGTKAERYLTCSSCGEGSATIWVDKGEAKTEA